MSLANVNPTNCTAFIQIWVDVNALTTGQITGCYAVDNLHGKGEGSASLNSVVPNKRNVCWQVLPIDPQYAGMFTIDQISAPSGWQSPPAAASLGQDVWTATVASSSGGSIAQGVTVNFNNGSVSWSGQLPITVSIS